MENLQMTYDLNQNQHRGDYGGGWFVWIFAIFILLLFSGFARPAYGGFGGVTPGMGMVNNDFLYTNLSNTIGQGFTQVTNQNFGLSKDMCAGFANLSNGISSLGYAMKDCCCETNRNIDAVRFNISEGLCGVNRNIDAVRYENAKNTGDITSMMQMLSMKSSAELTAGFQKILDKMCADKEAALTARINQLELGAAINAGNTRVIDAVRPYPQPAWVIAGSPYEAVNFGNCGGCGCKPGFYPNR